MMNCGGGGLMSSASRTTDGSSSIAPQLASANRMARYHLVFMGSASCTQHAAAGQRSLARRHGRVLPIRQRAVACLATWPPATGAAARLSLHGADLARAAVMRFSFVLFAIAAGCDAPPALD